MIVSSLRYQALVLLLVTAAGCAHRDHSRPESQAASRRAEPVASPASTALVRNALVSGPLEIGGSYISVSQHLSGGCLVTPMHQHNLFTIEDGVAKPDGYVAVTVPADGHVRFLYNDARNKGVCRFGIETTLKPDGKYSLRGGPTYVNGIPLITGGSGCALGVVDEETGLAVEARRLTPVDYCSRAK